MLRLLVGLAQKLRLTPTAAACVKGKANVGEIVSCAFYQILLFVRYHPNGEISLNPLPEG